MIEIILAALIVYLLQLMLPAVIGLLTGRVSTSYLLGPSDTAPETSPGIQRLKRAASNMGESLPAFMTLAVLSIISGAANAEIATYWVGLRIVYVITYWAHINNVRTIIWVLSIACLIAMALNLL